MIYITGANGWLGLNIVKSIKNGDSLKWGLPDQDMTCLILPNSDKSKLLDISSDIKIIEGNLLDKNSIDIFLKSSRNQYLIHTAGIIHPKKVKDFFLINVVGTKNLLEIAIKNSIKKAVIVSSNSPCGCNDSPDLLFDEKSPYNPYMNYGKSKMEMEIYVNKLFKKKLLDITIIRAPWFYGPNQPARQKVFFDMIRNGNGPILGDGNNLRSMAYVSNLAQGIILSLSKKVASGKTYWIADENPYTMNEIINTIESILLNHFKQECDLGRLRLPNLVSNIAETIDYYLQKLGIYHQKIHVLSEMNKHIVCDISLAKNELGYKPEYSLKKGMYNSIKELYE